MWIGSSLLNEVHLSVIFFVLNPLPRPRLIWWRSAFVEVVFFSTDSSFMSSEAENTGVFKRIFAIEYHSLLNDSTFLSF